MRKLRKTLLLCGVFCMATVAFSACDIFHAHTYTSVITLPTCTEQGYTTYTCSCGDTYTGDEVEALGHTETVTKKGYAATCEEDGLTDEVYCTVCQETIAEQKVLTAFGHSEVVTKKGYDAKCGVDGLTDEVYCTVCKQTVAEQEIIPALSHQYATTDHEAGGYLEHTCGVCGDSYNEKIENAKLLAYTVNEDGETCTITGLGEVTALDFVIPGWIYDGENVYQVTAIGDKAFNDCEKIRRIVIGENILSIGERAFWSCGKLQSIVIGENVQTVGKQAFYNCDKLESVVVPDSVTSIGDSAFAYIENLKSVKIGNGVLSIGQTAFRECSNLTEVTFGNAVETVGNQAFYWCDQLTDVILPDSVKEIGESAFSGCSRLRVTLGRGVKQIGASAFASCYALTEIVLPESVESIGEKAFQSCAALTVYSVSESKPSGWNENWNYSKYPVVWDCENTDIASDGYVYTVIGGVRYGIKDGVATVAKQSRAIVELTIPESISYHDAEYAVTSVAASAFSGNTSLQSVSIGNNVVSIGENAFLNCLGLEKLVFGDGITAIRAFEFKDYKKLKSVTLGANVETIGNSAFANCTSLSSVKMGEKVTELGHQVFQNCASLSEITLPNSVTKMGSSVFNGCSSLKQFIVPTGLTQIPELTFCDCSNLSKVVLHEDMNTIGYGAFYNCGSLTELALPENVTTVWGEAFVGCLSLAEILFPENVTTLGETLFRDCKGLTVYCETASQPNGWNSSWNTTGLPVVWNCNNNDIATDDYAYTVVDGVRYAVKDEEAIVARQSNALGAVHIPNSISYGMQTYPVTQISASAFYGNSRLTSVEIGDNVVSVGTNAFSNCENLALAKIGAKVNEIGANAFTQGTLTVYCAAASKPSGWSDTWNNAESPVVWDCENNDVATGGRIHVVVDGVRYAIKDGKASVEKQSGYITSANILGKITHKGVEYPVTKIEQEAFDYCNLLETVVIGEGVETIGIWAFRHCIKLTKIQLPKSVKTVEMGAFLECTALAELDLGRVETLGGYVFRKCNALTEVVIPNSLLSVGEEVFMECYELTLYKEADLQTSGWVSNWNSWYNEVWDGSLEWNPYGCPTYVYSESEPMDFNFEYWHYVDGEIVVW